MRFTIDQTVLEKLYTKYNRRWYAHPDPLEFLYSYENPADREIVALIASSLAYGRVAQILKSVSWVLKRMASPSRFLREQSPQTLQRAFADFRHRFSTGEELGWMLTGVRQILEEYGSLEKCFLAGLKEKDETVLAALTVFADRLTNGRSNSLLPSPRKGSACKRWNLFLRWMVRRDEVDPGGWDKIPSSKLIVPLDTHMRRISLAVKLTRRKQTNMRTALEITRAFETFAPDDPVKYDFALTRLGIREDARMEDFLKQCVVREAA